MTHAKMKRTSVAVTTAQEEPAFVVRSLTLTPTADAALRRLSRDASDYIGRTISGSAVVRALLHLGAQHGAAWVTAQLFPLIERELPHVTWGKRLGARTVTRSKKDA